MGPGRSHGADGSERCYPGAVDARFLPMTLAGGLALAGCVPEYAEPVPAHIAPLDGQTAVALTLPLRLETGGLDLPEDVPVPDESITVVDLDAGTEVRGALARDGDTLWFEPRGPWEAGHTYVWTVSDGPEEARQLALTLPSEVLGSASFRAGDGDVVLDAFLDSRRGDLCLVLSRVVDGAPGLELTVQDEPVEADWFLRAEDGIAQKQRTLVQDDGGVSLACSETLAPVPGSRVRVTWGEAGPWSFVVQERALRGATDPLRRVSP